MIRKISVYKRATNSGSILLTLIVVIVMVSMFTVTLLSMTNTTLFTNVNVNAGDRALYVAEAGYRYAASEYLNAGDMQDKLTTLEGLDDHVLTFTDNQGQCELHVYPYWFLPVKDYDAVQDIKVKVPGRIVSGYVFPSSGTVKISTPDSSSGNATFPATYEFTAGMLVDTQNATLTLSRPLDYPITTASSVYLVFNPSKAQTISSGGTLEVDSSMSGSLPVRNGLIEINDTTYIYKELQTTPSLALKGVTQSGGDSFSLTVGSTTNIILKRQMILESQGTVGSAPYQNARAIAYPVTITDEYFEPAGTPVPLSLSDEPKKQDTFADLENWHDPDDRQVEVASSVMPEGVYSDLDDSGHTEYVIFHDLIETAPPGGYTLRAVAKDDLPASVRNKDFYGIWGDAADDLYVVGEGGGILFFNGRVWTLMDSPTTKNLQAVWGIDSSHIVAVGNDGEVLVQEGSGWKRTLMGKPYLGWCRKWYYHRRWGWLSYNTNDDTYDPDASDISLSEFDLYGVWGTSWDQITTYGDLGGSPFKWEYPNYNGKIRYWNDSYLDLWYGSFSGTAAHWLPYDREGWKNRDFRSSWECDEGEQNIFSVGKFHSDSTKGFIFHEVPDGEFIEKDSSNKEFKKLLGIWGSSLNDIYAVGAAGSIYHNVDDGDNDEWQKVSNDLTDDTLNGVYGTSEDFVYAVGDNGVILHKNADGWSKIDNDVSTETLNDVWGNGDTNGLYAVGDDGTILYLGSEENPIKKDFLLLNKEEDIKNAWAISKYLTYTIQTKIGWGDNLKYAASGICFRWHKVSGKYAGYGVSFMQYAPASESNDFIPDSMKPDYKFTDDKSDRLLIVLWKQYVQDGIEKREWLAYKDITSDLEVVYDRTYKNLNDLSSLIVRVIEKNVDGMRVNDIDIFYGDASTKNSEGDTLWNNTKRKHYYPTFTDDAHTDPITWPIWDFDNWTITDDMFTVVDNVSVAASPVAGADYWVVNPFAYNVWLVADSHVIRTNDFLSPSSTYGDSEDRPEIGLCVFGDVGSVEDGNDAFVGFADFAVQLGTNSTGASQDSSFGRIQ